MGLSLAKRNLLSWQITRYVASEVLVSFGVGTTIFLLVLLMFQAIRLSEFVVVQQVPLHQVGKLSLYLMLTFLPIVVPVAFLFAVLMGISRANSEGELIAIQTTGTSLRQVYFPLGVFSVFVSLLSLYTALYTVPRANRAFELLITKLSSEKVISALKPGVFLEGFHGLVLFAEQILPLRNEMKRVFIYDDREGAYPLAITAKAGIMRQSSNKGALTLRLSEGTIHVDRRVSDGIQQRIDFNVYDINLEPPEAGDSWRSYSLPSFSYPEIRQRLRETANDPYTHRQLKVELHRRLSLAFACLIFSALGFFIGALSQRGMRSSAVVFCLGVGVVYWIAFIGSTALAAAGWVAPWLGTWAPNILFAFIAYYCYRRQVAG